MENVIIEDNVFDDVPGNAIDVDSFYTTKAVQVRHNFLKNLVRGSIGNAAVCVKAGITAPNTIYGLEVVGNHYVNTLTAADDPDLHVGFAYLYGTHHTLVADNIAWSSGWVRT